MKLSPPLRARLIAARLDIAARSGASTRDWSDDQSLSALSLVAGGHSVADAVAIVLGDAVLKDGLVDYNPGCAWIDFALAKRKRTPAEVERIVSQWESQSFDQPEITAAHVVDLGRSTAAQTGRALF